MKSNIRNSILPTAALCGLAIAAGIVTGALTAGFGRILLWIGTFRSNHLLWCLPFLPIAGVLMVWVYQKYGKESAQGMSLIFDAADGKAKRIPLRLIPLLIGSTWLTHLCGGSAGREGVAVQLGAAVSHNMGRRIPWFRDIPDAVPILTIAGMAAGFSGLFHAPLAAVCFALEVLAVGRLEYRALLPAVLAAVSANWVSAALGLETFQVALPDVDTAPFSVPILLLGVFSGIAGGIFTLLLKQGKSWAAKLFPNPLLRIAVCTLAVGFQGGEVTPLFAIGACLGAVAAPLFGLPAVFGAALCYAAVFGSASNTWLAPICIGTEVFGFSCLPYFAVVCTVSRLCSGNRSMYGKQKPSPLFLQK